MFSFKIWGSFYMAYETHFVYMTLDKNKLNTVKWLSETNRAQLFGDSVMKRKTT